MVSPRKYEPPQKRNSYFYYFSGQTLCQKESMGSKKKELMLFRAKHCAKKKRVPKKIWFWRKKEFVPFRARHCAKKVRKPKNSMTSEKKNLINLNYSFCRAEHCAKQTYGFQKKVWVPTKKLFFWPNIVLKKVCAPKKVWVPKKKELILLGTFLPVFFFCLNWISVETKKGTGKISFSMYFKQNKKYRQKDTQKYEFLFFNPYLFWSPYFFRHTVWPEKVWVPSFFGTHTLFWTHVFFGAIFGMTRYEFLLLRKSYFLKTHTVYFGTMFGTKKYGFLFFWNPYFF